jgi:pimeloyl-ACP methyl ester carboxylesterase
MVAISFACALTLTACGSDTSLLDDSGAGSTATWTPLPTIAGAVEPSATTNLAFVLPTQIVGGNIGANNFVPGAVPTVSGGLASATITPTPAPTQPSLPLFVQSGGLTLMGRYYPAVRHPATAALLLHGDGESKEGWGDLAALLQQAGYSALAIDLRGFGETGGVVDWTQAPGDSTLTLSYIHSLPGIDSAHSIAIGDGVGATLALTACAADSACQAAVLISPQLTIHGLSAQTAFALFTQSNKRALLILVASDSPNANDANTLNGVFAGTGIHQVLRYPGDATGMALLAAHPESLKAIVDWLTSLSKK